MRVLLLIIGTIIATIGGFLSGLNVFLGIGCLREASQLSTPDFLVGPMCSPFDPGTLVGLILLSAGLFVAYKNIHWSNQLHSGWKKLVWVAMLIPGFIGMCLLIGYLVLLLFSSGEGGVDDIDTPRSPSTDVQILEYQIDADTSIVPEDTESTPFGVDDIDTPRIPSTDVQILEYQIDADTSIVKGVLFNNTAIPITSVHLWLACENGQDVPFVVGSRKKTIRSLNRMTGQYENREYDAPEAIAPGQTYQFEYEMNDVTATSACSLSVDGWTDYRTINE